jgi:hypothetical protein
MQKRGSGGWLGNGDQEVLHATRLPVEVFEDDLPPSIDPQRQALVAGLQGKGGEISLLRRLKVC